MTREESADSLRDQHQVLCLQLQHNRRLVGRKMVAQHGLFPRSMTMRFLVNRPTEKLIAVAAIARILQKGKVGHSLVTLFRSHRRSKKHPANSSADQI